MDQVGQFVGNRLSNGNYRLSSLRVEVVGWLAVNVPPEQQGSAISVCNLYCKLCRSKIPGTVLKNQTTGEVIYTPPQNHSEIVALMGNLDKFINDPSVSDLDPLIKMALIHFQFESIYPYYDGNGRTGRVINILYLVKEELLSIPILYLSRYIIRHKDTYYQLFQEVRENQSWDKWVLFMLKGVEETSQETIALVKSIRSTMLSIKHQIREQFPGFYSQELVNNLFYHPYTKIAFIQKELLALLAD